MRIDEGNFYVRESQELETPEKYILLVVPRKETTPAGIYCTETLAVHADMSLFSNDWVESFLERKATPEEIALFNEVRSRILIATLGAIIVFYSDFLSCHVIKRSVQRFFCNLMSR